METQVAAFAQRTDIILVERVYFLIVRPSSVSLYVSVIIIFVRTASTCVV